MIVVNDSSTGNVKNKIPSVLYQFDRSEVEFDSTLFIGHFGWNTDENSIFGSSAMIVQSEKMEIRFWYHLVFIRTFAFFHLLPPRVFLVVLKT